MSHTARSSLAHDGACEPLDLAKLRFESLSERPSKVALGNLGRPLAGDCGLAEWLESLPRVLGASSLKQLRDLIVRASKARRVVVAALGGHVVKTGCAPYLVDWIDRGILQGLALNGASAIHDLELAIAGKTSEDVALRLPAGSFGFARETSQLFAAACARAAARSLGLGQALAEVILDHGGPGLHASLLVAAKRARVVVTVHVAIGTDIVHMTPELDGAALGQASLRDFRALCDLVARMHHGVWLNIGSAVVLPEVFLKAVAVARNLGHSLEGLTTANLDFEQKYRGVQNVLARPGGEGIALTGHHEIMIPLLHAAVAAQLAPGEAEGALAQDPTRAVDGARP